MSDTDRREKRERKERPFPYIPSGIRFVSTGPAYGEEDNMAYVETLLAVRQPELSNVLKDIVSEDCEGCQGR